jgi:multisubunit Na+/H+ antiporter MnhC subunit
MLDPEIITAEIKNATQWKTDPIFFIVGMGLFFLGIFSVIVMAGYIIYQIIWRGMDFPPLTQITVLLSGVMVGALGAFFLSLAYEEMEDKKKNTKKIMFSDG